MAARRLDPRLPAIALLFLGPVAVSLWVDVSAGKLLFAAAAVAALPVLLVADWRRGETVRGTLAGLPSNALAPFALLYGAAAVFGLLWGIGRGNDLILTIGQTWTAAMFLVGFCWVAPRVRALATPSFWPWFMAGVVVLSAPTMIRFGIAVAENPGAFVRFLAKTAFYGFVCLILALGFAVRGGALRTIVAVGFFGLLTIASFTRSYWLGAAVGVTLLAVFALRAHGGRAKLRARTMVAFGAALVVAVGAVAVSPLGPLIAERATVKRQNAVDASVEVRSHELRAAVDEVRARPFAGVGSGGTFTSVYSNSSSTIAYGETNFIHNAYVYFPLKFGLLGLAALIALALGVARCLAASLRRRDPLAADRRAYVAAFVAILAAAATAPNLVDPIYATFCGAIAGLAGAGLAAPAADAAPADVVPAAEPTREAVAA